MPTSPPDINPLTSPEAKALMRKCMALMGEQDIMKFLSDQPDEESQNIAAMSKHCLIRAERSTLTPFEAMLDDRKMRRFELRIGPDQERYQFKLDHDIAALRKSLLVANAVGRSDTLERNLGVISTAYHIFRKSLGPSLKKGQQQLDFDKNTVTEYIDAVIHHIDDLRALVNKKPSNVVTLKGR
jgi:hypothetical protein